MMILVAKEVKSQNPPPLEFILLIADNELTKLEVTNDQSPKAFFSNFEVELTQKS